MDHRPLPRLTSLTSRNGLQQQAKTTSIPSHRYSNQVRDYMRSHLVNKYLLKYSRVHPESVQKVVADSTQSMLTYKQVREIEKGLKSLNQSVELSAKQELASPSQQEPITKQINQETIQTPIQQSIEIKHGSIVQMSQSNDEGDWMEIFEYQNQLERDRNRSLGERRHIQLKSFRQELDKQLIEKKYTTHLTYQFNFNYSLKSPIGHN